MIIIPDQKYNPNFIDHVHSGTKLAPGVSIAKFLGTRGNPASLSTIFKYRFDQNSRKQLARNLYFHAELYRMINGNTDFFKDVRLSVVEGVYRGGPLEKVANENQKKQDGLLIGYTLIDEAGTVDLERIFDLAEYWKDYANYEKLILEYDNWNPNGELYGQVTIEMPVIPETFDVEFGMKVETRYNGQLLATNELIEVLNEV